MSALKPLRPVAFALCAVLSWGSAQAATVTQSQSFISPTFTFTGSGTMNPVVSSSFYTASFNPFDSSLGTLTGFKITWEVDTSVTFTVNSPSNVGVVTVSGGGTYWFNASAYAGNGYSGPSNIGNATPSSGPVTINPGFTHVNDFLVSNAGVTYDPAMVTAIKGTNPLSLKWQAATNVTYNFIDTGSAVARGKVTLDYIYTAAASTDVPEPGSLALVFGGLLAAFAVRRAQA